MKLAVIGSREFNDYNKAKHILNKLIEKYDVPELVSGGAKGADAIAERYAEENDIPISIILPDWDRYGKSAGFIRNSEIWKEADIGLAFWDGKSKGTKHSLELSKKLNKTLIVYEYNTNKIYKV